MLAQKVGQNFKPQPTTFGEFYALLQKWEGVLKPRELITAWSPKRRNSIAHGTCQRL
jgi:hypothetical protein